MILSFNSEDILLSKKDCVKQSVVYLITDDTGFVKIGYTTDFESRFSVLSVGSPRQLRLLLAIRSTAELESHLHSHFFRYRRKGEWFALTGKLKEFIEQCQDLASGKAQIPEINQSKIKLIPSSCPTVFIETQKGRLRLRWRYQKKRYTLSLGGLPDSPIGVSLAKERAGLIERDILTDSFDQSLAKYKKFNWK